MATTAEPSRKLRSKRRIALRVLLGLAVLVVILNWTWGRLPSEPKAPGAFAQVGDTRVHYVERPGRDPAIVLVHGLPGSFHDFDRVTRLLPGRHTIAIDRPGFAYSSGGYHPMREQVATLQAFLAQRHVTRPVLVGHSYGGTVVLSYAASHPGAVRGLVLVDAAAGGFDGSVPQDVQTGAVRVLSWPVVQPLADITFSQAMRTAAAKQGDDQAFSPDPVDPAHERHLLELNMRHEDLDAFVGEHGAAEDVIKDLDKRLPGVAVPATVIQGDHDKLVTPDHARRIAASLPNARLVMLPGGHMAPYVRPRVVADAAVAMAGGGGR